MAKSLTDEQLEVITRRRGEGATYTAIAKEVGCSPRTVYVRLTKGRVPVEAAESDAFLKALEKLEHHFPGAIAKIQAGNVKVVTSVKIELTRY